MAGAAPADEMVFTGADDASASPVAQQIIKQLMDRGISPTAGNMRRAVEANARGTGQAGADPLEGVRNDVVENSAPAASGSARPRQGTLPTPPIPPDVPTSTSAAPATTASAVPVVDPESGVVVSPEGGMDGATLGSLVAMAMPLLYGAKRAFGGGGNMPTMTVTPQGQLPAPPVQPQLSGPPTPPQLPAPQAQLPAPQAKLPAPQQALPAPTTSALPPGANAAPSVIRMPGPPAAPIAPPAAVVPAPPPVPTAPSQKALLDILMKNKGGVGRFGAGIPFITGSPQEIMSTWKR